MTVLNIKISISVTNKPAAPCIQGGRRQGRSLKIRRTPLGEQGVMESRHHSAESAVTGGPAPAAGPSKIRAQNASFFKPQFQHVFFHVKSAKTAKSAKHGALFELQQAHKNVKSATNCYSRAPSDLFRKQRRNLSLFWCPKTSKTMLPSKRELHSHFRH